MRTAVMSMGDACAQEEQATMKHRTARHTTPRHVKTHPQLPPMDGKEGATVRQEHSDAGAEKDPKNGVKKKKKQSSPTAATHPTTQVIITETNTTHGNSQRQ
ncbi:hypothetical protein TCDM_11463 [Trypanosoma cruzi Dm28c]|uniref:Uncharacterized protein n=1 Tax=Trypanosoma cruzi Dm28c TaxID=1416333 RepID=V5B0B9_TRYCR|nr:hypothetical protein TCDM_11463 [Trypanosoma cruzi Dm28c]